MIIENEDVLQACATILAGILIFLTIERKLDAKDTELELFELSAQYMNASFAQKNKKK